LVSDVSAGSHPADTPPPVLWLCRRPCQADRHPPVGQCGEWQRRLVMLWIILILVIAAIVYWQRERLSNLRR